MKPNKELLKLIDNIISVIVKMYDRDSSIEKEMRQVHKSITKIVDHQAVDLYGSTALHHSVGNLEIMKALLASGFDSAVNIQNNEGNTALIVSYAQSKSKYDADWSQPNVELLKHLGASTNRFPEIDFINDANNGSNENVMKFIQDGGNINCTSLRGVSALAAEMGGNQVSTLRILLNNGAVIEGLATPFCLVVSQGYTEIVKELINRGIDVNAPDDSNHSIPLWRAIEHNNIEMVEILLEAGAEVPKKGSTHDYVLKDSKVINLKIYHLLIASTVNSK